MKMEIERRASLEIVTGVTILRDSDLQLEIRVWTHDGIENAIVTRNGVKDSFFDVQNVILTQSGSVVITAKKMAASFDTAQKWAVSEIETPSYMMVV